MKNNFQIREKKAIYLNGKQFISEAFDETFKFENFIIAYNSGKLVIVNCDEGTIFSKKGIVMQVYNEGQYIALRDINGYMGVIRYDYATVVPFEFYATLILDNGIEILRTSNSNWEHYEIEGK